jgi:prepilin-type N-terminal cleavage/methylation domain-containing protein
MPSSQEAHAMRSIRARLAASGDAGFSLVEVVVAMMIFALIATGGIYAMASTMTVTRDTRARQVAANLASEEIDLARDTADLMTLEDGLRSVELGGQTYHVKRTARWVRSSGNDLDCGSAGDTLRFKRVNVAVSWDNMRQTTEPVRSDTLIDPNSRLNDPEKGTILVKVVKPSGAGTPDVTVTATPAKTGTGLPSYTAKETDEQGCTYILQVVPGAYNVTVSHPGGDYVDEDQSPTSTTTVGVTPGDAVSAGFQYSESTQVSATYAQNVLNASTLLKVVPSELYLPNNLDTSFLSSSPTYVEGRSGSGPTLSRQAVFSLQPNAGGYQVVAGLAPTIADGTDGCRAVDPEAWAPYKKGKTTWVGFRNTAVTPAKGTVPPVAIDMGGVVLTRDLLGANIRYIKAVSMDSTAGGSPGCRTPMTYLFGPINRTVLPSPFTLALPYGSWTLTAGDTATTATQAIDEKKVSIAIDGDVTKGKGGGTIVTLDPRIVATDGKGVVVPNPTETKK